MNDAAANADRHDRRLRLVANLCRELAGLGFNAGMSDAGPSAMIYRPAGLSITVDDSERYFVWCDGQRTHPVSDPTGAAQLIAQNANACPAEEGKPS